MHDYQNGHKDHNRSVIRRDDKHLTFVDAAVMSLIWDLLLQGKIRASCGSPLCRFQLKPIVQIPAKAKA